MNRVHPVRLFSLASLAIVAACSGGGSAGTAGGEFIVLKTEPSDNATLFLNDSIRIDFSEAVDLGSVDLTTFSFQVLDQIGNVVFEPVAGNFALDASPGDEEVGRRLLFVPKLPTNDQFTNGGFRPGRTYVVQLIGGTSATAAVIRNTRGKPLDQPVTFRFSTSDGASPSQLFRNPASGGPRRAGFEITPTPDLNGVTLNKIGAPPVEIRLRFDQPLNPSSANVPVNLDTDPLVRNPLNRGRIFLRYDDPTLGEDQWIPADVELEDNSATGATVVLRPVGVLPNNATVVAFVDSSLEDIAGESNAAGGSGAGSYNPQFGTFQTQRGFESQFDGIAEDFLAASIDTSAPLLEPSVEVGNGYMKAGFAFEGTSTSANYEPVADVTLNTNFTQVTPSNGAPFNVSGGVFNFNNVTINGGIDVRGTGNNPMVWLVSGEFKVEGSLSVDGENGTSALSTGNADDPKPGGFGQCRGGDGGAGSPSAVGRDEVGGTGNGPGQLAGGGGGGGAFACLGNQRGSGGGGGSFVTQGDPNYKRKAIPPGGTIVFTQFEQQIGVGGPGGAGAAGAGTRSLQGGTPGPIVFVDSRTDNNFWGVGIRRDTQLRITGELAAPIGGGGGGGGGDLSYNTQCTLPEPNFASDRSGGGGGGGGGVLIVKALGRILITGGGRVSANGGHGGGGEGDPTAASSTRGGGGGGGAGGMVVLMSATGIDIMVRGVASAPPQLLYGGTIGATAQNNYDFAVSADGGVCRGTGTYFTTPNGPVITKYPLSNIEVPANFPTQYDNQPLGGFGGMGIVQLMAPAGTNADATNTVLDDNIRFFVGTTLLGGAQPGLPTKQQTLAWRGFPNLLGQGVDDTGAPINIGDNEGEIRPSPILLPAPFGAVTRARSKWIDTGVTLRQSGAPNAPRCRDPFVPDGVRYEFAATTSAAGDTLGYAEYSAPSTTATVVYPTAVGPTPILAVALNSTYLGKPAYRVQLNSPVLGTEDDRYVQYQAEALTAGNVLMASFRILSHTDRELVLSTESGAFPANAASMRVRAKFFDVITNGQPGLGTTYLGLGGATGAPRVPNANVKIGFAFHTADFSTANQGATDANRYPTANGTFVYDLSDPAVQEAIRLQTANTQHLSFVQWDVIFDTQFRSVVTGSPVDVPPPLSPSTPRPELHFLRVPFRY